MVVYDLHMLTILHFLGLRTLITVYRGKEYIALYLHAILDDGSTAVIDVLVEPLD